MQQCQNDWQAWHILQGALSRRSGRKQEKLRKKSGKLRCRCGFARTLAFQHGCLDMLTKRDTETEPHTHTDTHTGCLYHSFSQALSVSGLQKFQRIKNTDVIMAPAWMLLIERIKNTDVIMAPAWMLFIERIKNTDVITPAWMLFIERITNTDVIMASACLRSCHEC